VSSVLALDGQNRMPQPRSTASISRRCAFGQLLKVLVELNVGVSMGMRRWSDGRQNAANDSHAVPAYRVKAAIRGERRQVPTHPDKTQIGRWRKRAEEIRTVAETMRNSHARDDLLKIAGQWDAIAERAERSET
jgi:hypothetical protein